MSVSWMSTTIWILNVRILITGWLNGRNLSYSDGYWCMRTGTPPCLYIHCPKQRQNLLFLLNYTFFFNVILWSTFYNQLQFVGAPFAGTKLRSWSVLSWETNCNYVDWCIRRQYCFKETEKFWTRTLFKQNTFCLSLILCTNRLRFLWLL